MTKLDKKQYKNLQKCLKHLSALVGYECTLSAVPTQYMILGNAGHANCIGRSDVTSRTAHIPLQYQILFPPNKQFSVLKTEDVSEDLYTELNCTKLCNNIVYCGFLTQHISFQTLKESTRPPGLKIFENILDIEAEQSLIKYFTDKAQTLGTSQDDLKNRVTLHFGYKFDYKTNSVDLRAPLDDAIPGCIQDIISLISPHITINPNQITVNIYQPGQGIPKHVDTHSIFTSEILSVSLGSDVVMEFKQPGTGQILPVMLPARSLTVMSGESRYLWHHGITPRKHDSMEDVVARGLRISLTLRECTPEPCKCAYPTQCDSQNYGKPSFVVQSDCEASRLEREYVSDVYEDIAEHFSNTRHSTWPGVLSFINSLPPHSLVADVGCGNGKYLGTLNDSYFIGNDNSLNLCKICRERQHEVFVCNALNIPMREGTCDGVLCIAMLHHLTTIQRRVNVLRNIANLLRPGGLGLVTVWAQEQDLDVESTDALRLCNTNTTEQSVGRRQFHQQDCFVDWQLKSGGSEQSVLYHRYYHVFQQGELDRLFSELPDVQLVNVSYEKANWCAIFRKL